MINKDFLDYLTKVREYKSTSEIIDSIELLISSFNELESSLERKTQASLDKRNFTMLEKYSKQMQNLEKHKEKLENNLLFLKEKEECEKTIEEIIIKPKEVNENIKVVVKENKIKHSTKKGESEYMKISRTGKYKELIEVGVLKSEEYIYVKGKPGIKATLLQNGNVMYKDNVISINGWLSNIFKRDLKSSYTNAEVLRDGRLVTIDSLREEFSNKQVKVNNTDANNKQQDSIIAYEILGTTYAFRSWKRLFVNVIDLIVQEDSKNMKILKNSSIPKSILSFTKRDYQTKNELSNGQVVYVSGPGRETKRYLKELLELVNLNNDNTINLKYKYRKKSEN